MAMFGLAGCATTTASGPVEVTRFHLGSPLETGTVTVDPMPGGGAPSLEFKTYAAAVETELLRSGFSVPPPGASGQYLAVVGFTRTAREGPPRSSGLTVGIGGGGYSGGRGGGVGLGGGVSFPVGKPRTREIILTELSVQIRRRSDGTAIWEGRAQTQADARATDAEASAAAGKLANALFRGFPGESGRTITVR
jgi:hypothetical protein